MNQIHHDKEAKQVVLRLSYTATAFLALFVACGVLFMAEAISLVIDDIKTMLL